MDIYSLTKQNYWDENYNMEMSKGSWVATLCQLDDQKYNIYFNYEREYVFCVTFRLTLCDQQNKLKCICCDCEFLSCIADFYSAYYFNC